MAGAGFTAAEAGWLSAGAAAAAYGEVDWREQAGSYRADVPIAADGFADGDVDLVYQVNPQLPWQPSAVLRIRHDWRARICVNRAHREGSVLLPPAPHLHSKRSSEHRAVWRELGDPPLHGTPVGGPVQAGAHLGVVARLCGEYSVSLDGLLWTDPPEGEV